MTTPASVRFCIIADGNPRCILSVGERKCGDLILHVRAGEMMREFGTLIEQEAKTDHRHRVKIVEKKYSVHMSPNSASGLNVIKLTNALSNGKVESLSNYTAAIKQKHCFAGIYGRRFPNLREHHYDLRTKKGRSVCVGSIDTGFLSLVMGVFVGPNDRKFKIPHGPRTFNILQHEFTHFRLVLLWSFLTFPSLVSSGFGYAYTLPGDRT